MIDGAILYSDAEHRLHARIKSRLFRLLSDRLDDIGGLEAIVEGAIGIPPLNAPEPDIVVTDDPEGTGPVRLGSVGDPASAVTIAGLTVDTGAL